MEQMYRLWKCKSQKVPQVPFLNLNFVDAAPKAKPGAHSMLCDVGTLRILGT